MADSVIEAIANYGPLVLLAVLALIWLLPRPTAPRPVERRAVIYALLIAALALGANQVIGHLWARPRPGMKYVVTQLLSPSSDASFPSDHATLCFGLALPVLLVLRRAGVLLIVCSLVVGFARVYVGRHYPGDVLGSLVVAALVTGLVWQARGRIEWIVAPLLAILARLRLASVDDARLPAA
jgi:undecaprenyl-diphosphatase